MRRPLPLSLALGGATLAALGAAPAAAQERLIVLEKDAATARVLDPATGATAFTLPTGPFPHEVTVSPDGRWAVVADYGAQTPGHTLTVLDLGERKVARTIDLGEYRRPHGIVWLPGGGARVAVTSEQSRALLLVDVAAGRVEAALPTAQNGTHMVALSPDGRTAYTANIGSGSVTMFDLAARQAVRTVTTGTGPEAIDVSPDGRELWTADRTLNYVRVLDARTLDSLATLPTNAFPNRLKFTPDGRYALVSNAAASTVTIYDVRARTLAATVTLPLDRAKAPPAHLASAMGTSAMPLGILVAPDGARAWVATAGANEIVELDLQTFRVGRAIRTGATPDGMALLR